MTPAMHASPVSLTPAKTFFAGVIDTGKVGDLYCRDDDQKHKICKSGYRFGIYGSEKVTTSSEQKTVTTFIRTKNSASACFLASLPADCRLSVYTSYFYLLFFFSLLLADLTGT
jgi:hypothetical protein